MLVLEVLVLLNLAPSSVAASKDSVSMEDRLWQLEKLVDLYSHNTANCSAVLPLCCCDRRHRRRRARPPPRPHQHPHHHHHQYYHHRIC